MKAFASPKINGYECKNMYPEFVWNGDKRNTQADGETCPVHGSKDSHCEEVGSLLTAFRLTIPIKS